MDFLRMINIGKQTIIISLKKKKIISLIEKQCTNYNFHKEL